MPSQGVCDTTNLMVSPYKRANKTSVTNQAFKRPSVVQTNVPIQLARQLEVQAVLMDIRV